MKRKTKAKKIANQTKDFLKKNPAIKKALRTFNISHSQYQKTLEGRYSFYTDTSTSLKK